MGQTFSSEPVVEKETERDHNDTFNVAVSSCQGWRMSQEDNHSLMLELPGEHKAAFFAVYDGHGSARVSKHASEGLWRHLVENESYPKGNFKEALEKAFLTFDREVNESYNAQLAGTTAVCLLIVSNKIYCANIGDSRGVASINCECVPLSYDHKPENPQELKRILAAGGYVLGNRVNGNLALSRAFGDFHYKGNEQLPPEDQIVSPCPDVKTIELNDDVDFLVLACDGIWDVLSSEEVIEFVVSRLEQNMEPGLICEQLTTRCLATDYELVIGCDNMTVLLVCYTRGRSWLDFCTDIFNKNTRKLGGLPRARPNSDESSIEIQDRDNSDRFDKLNENNAKELYNLLDVLKSENEPSTAEESSSTIDSKANEESTQDTSRAAQAEEVENSNSNPPELPQQNTCTQSGEAKDGGLEKIVDIKEEQVCSIIKQEEGTELGEKESEAEAEVGCREGPTQEVEQVEVVLELGSVDDEDDGGGAGQEGNEEEAVEGEKNEDGANQEREAKNEQVDPASNSVEVGS